MVLEAQVGVYPVPRSGKGIGRLQLPPLQLLDLDEDWHRLVLLERAHHHLAHQACLTRRRRTLEQQRRRSIDGEAEAALGVQLCELVAEINGALYASKLRVFDIDRHSLVEHAQRLEGERVTDVLVLLAQSRRPPSAHTLEGIV